MFEAYKIHPEFLNIIIERQKVIKYRNKKKTILNKDLI